jgi:hypothetical protein
MGSSRALTKEVQVCYSRQFRWAYEGKVQVVARDSSGVLARHFRKLDRDTRLKAVQVH